MPGVETSTPKAWPYRQAVRAMWEPLERTEV